mmetsp:Transcript_4755/g.8832  ORF Transcript_4755/g.8832 Transcript_4755/m.8832 type:complete len:243 (+) Transcript_4755:698-1426(+)
MTQRKYMSTRRCIPDATSVVIEGSVRMMSMYLPMNFVRPLRTVRVVVGGSWSQFAEISRQKGFWSSSSSSEYSFCCEPGQRVEVLSELWRWESSSSGFECSSLSSSLGGWRGFPLLGQLPMTFFLTSNAGVRSSSFEDEELLTSFTRPRRPLTLPTSTPRQSSRSTIPNVTSTLSACTSEKKPLVKSETAVDRSWVSAPKSSSMIETSCRQQSTTRLTPSAPTSLMSPSLIRSTTCFRIPSA